MAQDIQKPAPPPPPDPDSIGMSDFFEKCPPGVKRKISDGKERDQQGVGSHLKLPPLKLHCSTASCNGERIFETSDWVRLESAKRVSEFVDYQCRNCRLSAKRYSLLVEFIGDVVSVTKYGEIPAFGPNTPPRALTLIGGDRDLFLKGRRCENQGLGIGAFTYYRRVIEGQRNRIFDEIIRVLEAIDPKNDVIEDIRAAKNQRQFSTSVETIKHALPSSLLINGQNPLLLLHSALSEGLHAMTDDECLELAAAARTVLFEFSERLAQALRDDAELSSAVTLLAQLRSNQKQG